MLNIIVSCAENRVIGRAGRLPWRIPEDRRFFHQRTAGQVVLMGRICYENWPEASVDGRRAVVVTSGAVPAPLTAPSFPEALALAETLPGEIYVCGGERIYAEAMALPRPLRLYLTLVHAEPPGDRFFPEWRDSAWREIERRESSDPGYRYTFLTLER
jgi:dihydrofolate reductase